MHSESTMLTELALTHECDQVVFWTSGGYFDRRGRPVTHCPGCAEWLGTPFRRVEAATLPTACGHNRTARRRSSTAPSKAS